MTDYGYQQLLESYRAAAARPKRRTTRPLKRSKDPLGLTPGQRRIVDALLAGFSTRQIAETCNLTVATVHTYLKRIYCVTKTHHKAELIALAHKNS